MFVKSQRRHVKDLVPDVGKVNFGNLILNLITFKITDHCYELHTQASNKTIGYIFFLLGVSLICGRFG